MGKSRIFLCYAREDQRVVEDVYKKLRRRRDLKPWMASRDILPGAQWEIMISQAIRGSDFFVAFLSNNSVDKRGQIQKELRQALDVWQEKLPQDIYLIPARLEECEVPEQLRRFQWVDLFQADGLTRLVEAIRHGAQSYKTGPAGRSSRPVGRAPCAIPVQTDPPASVTEAKTAMEQLRGALERVGEARLEQFCLDENVPFHGFRDREPLFIIDLLEHLRNRKALPKLYAWLQRNEKDIARDLPPISQVA